MSRFNQPTEVIRVWHVNLKVKHSTQSITVFIRNVPFNNLNEGMGVTTEELILSRTGGSPLLSLAQVAEILHRSPDGLRITLSGDNEIARNLKPCRIKIGRRVYFRVAGVARFIDEA